MIKKITIFLTAGAIIIIAGWLLYPGEKPVIPQENIQENVKSKVYLTIDYSEGAVQNFESDFRERMTAFDLLKKKTGELNLFLKSKDSDFGVFVEAIRDKENGEAGKYWLYYVNKELPMVAADKLALKSGDKVEFKFEKPSF